MKKYKEYEVYPTLFGVSCYSKYYNGTSIKVMAKSIKQAYYLAHNRIWMKDENDMGVKEIYVRGEGYTNWKGEKYQ